MLKELIVKANNILHTKTDVFYDKASIFALSSHTEGLMASNN